MEVNLNGLTIYRSTAKEGNGECFIPLPREAWRSAGKCNCQYCKGNEGFWDTLVIPNSGRTCNVHMPELQTKTPEWLTRQW